MLGTNNDTFVSLTAVLCHADVIDKETKQMALDRGAHFLVETLIKICRENPIYTEIIVEKMKGEEKLSHIMEAVETQKAAAPERCLSYKGY